MIGKHYYVHSTVKLMIVSLSSFSKGMECILRQLSTCRQSITVLYLEPCVCYVCDSRNLIIDTPMAVTHPLVLDLVTV